MKRAILVVLMSEEAARQRQQQQVLAAQPPGPNGWRRFAQWLKARFKTRAA